MAYQRDKSLEPREVIWIKCTVCGCKDYHQSEGDCVHCGHMAFEHSSLETERRAGAVLTEYETFRILMGIAMSTQYYRLMRVEAERMTLAQMMFSMYREGVKFGLEHHPLAKLTPSEQHSDSHSASHSHEKE